jgi:endonuclease/exonuclease/phosphatase family metal-dependent hydrolase
MLSLRRRPDVIAFSEVTEAVAASIGARLSSTGYQIAEATERVEPSERRVAIASRLGVETIRSKRFEIPDEHPVAAARGYRVWARAVCSARVRLCGVATEVHAVHVPNAAQYAWEKFDHLWALRYGMEGTKGPAILCGDFNAPYREDAEGIITNGQGLDRRIWTRSPGRRYGPERPWNGEQADAAERAVLEGLGDAVGMHDAFRFLHPRALEVTWRQSRLDHVFASSELKPLRCRHLHSWREEGLSDHSAVDATFEMRWR